MYKQTFVGFIKSITQTSICIDENLDKICMSQEVMVHEF